MTWMAFGFGLALGILIGIVIHNGFVNGRQ
jgi:hypothetical protein